MNFARLSPKIGIIALSAVGLTGCFDLTQKVAVRHDGSGTYAVEIAANGVVGEGLRQKDNDDFDIGGDMHGTTHISRNGDVTTRSEEVAFKDISELKLDDEQMNLHVKGHGGDATELHFHRTFNVGSARHDRDDKDDEQMGREVLQSMFGGHTYTFVVWLPGHIERIAPVSADGHLVVPTVWGDASGHTIIWKMQLTDMMMSDNLNFDVDFSAKGDFHDAQSQPAPHHHHGGHHHDDDGDGDD